MEYNDTITQAELRASAHPPPGIDAATFPAWVEAESHRIAGLPVDEQVQALAEFEAQCAEFDALPIGTRDQAIALAEPKPPRPRQVNVFDPRCYPGPNVPVVLEDLERPGWFIARRGANRQVVGHGATQLEALADLEAQCSDNPKI